MASGVGSKQEWAAVREPSRDGDPWHGEHAALSLRYVRRIVEFLCDGLRHMGAGALHDAGDAFSEAARRIDHVCCDTERHLYLADVETVPEVRDLVLTCIPGLLAALQEHEAGRHREAWDALDLMPAGLWKAAGYLFHESSRRYGTPIRPACRDAFFQPDGQVRLHAIRAALDDLMAQPGSGQVVVEAVGEDRRVVFHQAAGRVLELELGLGGLSTAEQRRADVFFASMPAVREGERLRVRLGRDAEAGARLAAGIFDVVFDIGDGYDLVVDAS